MRLCDRHTMYTNDTRFTTKIKEPRYPENIKNSQPRAKLAFSPALEVHQDYAAIGLAPCCHPFRFRIK